MDCINQKKNSSDCPCVYEPCSKKGICCSCVAYHRGNNDLPACLRVLSSKEFSQRGRV